MDPRKYFKRYIRLAPFSHAVWRGMEAGCFAEFEKFVKGDILDIGCGFGEFVGIVFDNMVEVGIDINKKDLVKAASGKSYKNLILADARKLPFDDGSFDCVVSISTLEHIKKVDKAIEEVERVLKKGGIFIFSVPTNILNKHLFFPSFLRKIGLGELSNLYVKIFHWAFSHENIYSKEKWMNKILSGFKVLDCRGTINTNQIRIFELFLPLAFFTQFNRKIFGKRLLFSFKFREMIFEKIFSFFWKGDLTDANIIIVATKK